MGKTSSMDFSRSTAEDFPRTAIVTGSDSGIGKATAVALAELGCDVGITWHTDEQGAKATADEVRATGRRAEVQQLDLTALPGAATVIDELSDALGGLDVLVNNAGTGSRALLVDLDAGSIAMLFASLLIGTPALSLIGSVAAALSLGARRQGVVLSLLVLPLYIPPLIFGAGAVEANSAGSGARAYLLILSAVSLAALALCPWASAAALRQALE